MTRRMWAAVAILAVALLAGCGGGGGGGSDPVNPGRTFTGQVLTDTGAAAPGVTIYVITTDNTVYNAVTGADGRFTVTNLPEPTLIRGFTVDTRTPNDAYYRVFRYANVLYQIDWSRVASPAQITGSVLFAFPASGQASAIRVYASSSAPPPPPDDANIYPR